MSKRKYRPTFAGKTTGGSSAPAQSGEPEPKHGIIAASQQDGTPALTTTGESLLRGISKNGIELLNALSPKDLQDILDGKEAGLKKGVGVLSGLDQNDLQRIIENKTQPSIDVEADGKSNARSTKARADATTSTSVAAKAASPTAKDASPAEHAASMPEPGEVSLEEFQRLVRSHSGPIDLTVGPTVMSEVLKMRSPNKDRPLQNSKVAMYVADMAAGRWLPIGDPVTISRSGVRTNGQHRAEAVVRFGKTVKMPFRFGAEDGVYELHDSGLPRTFGHVLASEGLCEGKGKRYMAWLAAVLVNLSMIENQVEKIDLDEKRGMRLNAAEEYRRWEKHIQWFVDRAATRKISQYSPFMATLAASAWIFAHQYGDVKKLNDGLDRFFTGNRLEEGDPVRAARIYVENRLRPGMANGSSAREKDERFVSIEKILYTIHLLLDGDEITKLQPKKRGSVTTEALRRRDQAASKS